MPASKDKLCLSDLVEGNHCRWLVRQSRETWLFTRVVAKWWRKRIGCHAPTTDKPGPHNKRSSCTPTCKQDPMMTATFETSHPNQSECTTPKTLHTEPSTDSCQSPLACYSTQVHPLGQASKAWICSSSCPCSGDRQMMHSNHHLSWLEDNVKALEVLRLSPQSVLDESDDKTGEQPSCPCWGARKTKSLFSCEMW